MTTLIRALSTRRLSLSDAPSLRTQRSTTPCAKIIERTQQ